MSVREYQFGSTGEDVKRIQRALNEKSGSSLEIDGKYGVLTQAAVIKFQESREDLRVDGIVGAFTWDALGLNELTPPGPDLFSSAIEPPTATPTDERNKPIQERRTRQKQKEQAQNKAVEAVTVDTDTELPKDQQPSGQDKLNQLTVKKAINFVGANLGVIDQVLASLGLPNSKDLRELEAQGEQAIKAFVEARACANPDLLKEAVRIRNLLNQELGKLGSYYNLTNESINQLSDFLSGQINSSKLLKALRGITSQASKFVPSPPGIPGIVTSTLSDVSAVVDLIIFTALGQPKLAKAKAKVDNGLMFLSISAQVLKILLGPLRILDQILVKCGQTIDPIPDSIIELEQLNQTENFAGSSNYKGFTLEIREEPFSSTVTRRKAVAINSQGIVLVETPLSFTTLDQVLLDQVKFVIDSQNLKPF